MYVFILRKIMLFKNTNTDVRKTKKITLLSYYLKIFLKIV